MVYLRVARAIAPEGIVRDDVTDRLATVTVTVKLTPEEVAWLDRRVQDRYRQVDHERVAYDRYTRVRPSRSSVVRALVHAAMKDSPGPLFEVEPAEAESTEPAPRTVTPSEAARRFLKPAAKKKTTRKR